ncbi:MAG: hypothetical protein JJU28_25300 [Cyclobacteriaceae bacterium]|nr:hypothetical protein [Cyclobacteriaceae bacterium]
MKKIMLISALSLMVLSPLFLAAQSQWPREIPFGRGGIITMYQPQPEDLNQGVLYTRSAVSVRSSRNAEPVFGVVWIEGRVNANRNGTMYSLNAVSITEARFPETAETPAIEDMSLALAGAISSWTDFISVEELNQMLRAEREIASNGFRDDVPNIIYTEKPTLLVTIDGEPFVRHDQELGMERVMNSPFLIVKNPDDRFFYLYGEGYWYQSHAVTHSWKPAGRLPRRIAAVDAQINEYKNSNNGMAASSFDFPPEVLISTDPAELIQSDGMPNFASIDGTSLLYMTNTRNSIFMHIDTQRYYLLLTGRWYWALKMHGPWNFTSSDRLPADFALIPEGSAVDGVLSSIAGTPAAREAILDAYVPQTARVDRHAAHYEAYYDGEPVFEPIHGTGLHYAVNTQGSVIRRGNRFYAVDNGVWFVSNRPVGPWMVAVERPYEVMFIPAAYPVYNLRYVHIYDVGPDFVYMGYTHGYLGSYVYGPTVVYGTGFRYRPWFGAYYYPRPLTWGFGMYYNPWAGWTMNYGFSVGWFSFHYHRGPRWAGWWGPPVYCPPFRPYHFHGGYHYSFYGPVHNHIHVRNTVVVNNYHTHNVYRHRQDVVTRDRINYGAPVTRVQTSQRGATQSRVDQSTGRNAGSSRIQSSPNMRQSGTGTAVQGRNSTGAATSSRSGAIQPGARTSDRNTSTPAMRGNGNTGSNTQGRIQGGTSQNPSGRGQVQSGSTGRTGGELNRTTNPANRNSAGSSSSRIGTPQGNTGSRSSNPAVIDRNDSRSTQAVPGRSAENSSNMRTAPSNAGRSAMQSPGNAGRNENVQRQPAGVSNSRTQAPSVQRSATPSTRENAVGSNTGSSGTGSGRNAAVQPNNRSNSGDASRGSAVQPNSRSNSGSGSSSRGATVQPNNRSASSSAGRSSSVQPQRSAGTQRQVAPAPSNQRSSQPRQQVGSSSSQSSQRSAPASRSGSNSRSSGRGN